ncbi:hypothetical protein ACM66B_003496 [Microbotryomycetes sp. NB124-2]
MGDDSDGRAATNDARGLKARPVASTSRCTLESFDLSTTTQSTCTCFSQVRQTKRRARGSWWRAATTTAACVFVGSALDSAQAAAVPLATGQPQTLQHLQRQPRAPAAATGAVYARQATPQHRRRDDNVRTTTRATASTSTPRKRRDVLDKYELVDGEWIVNHDWTLRGRTGQAPTTPLAALAPSPSVESADDDDAAMGEANVEPTRTLSTSSKLSTARPSLYSSTVSTPKPSSSAEYEPHASPKIAAAATSSSFSIPDGWAATPRETGFYAVPIIVAMSVLVAVMVIGTVFGSVLWRRHERNKRKRRRARRKAQQAGLVTEKVEGEGDGDHDGDAAAVVSGRVAKLVSAVGIRRKRKHAKTRSELGTTTPAEDTTSPTTAEAHSTALERTATRGTVSSGRRTAGQVRAAIVAGSARIRRRRRNRLGIRTSDHPGADSSDDDDDAHSMTEALTQSDSAARRPDTLTARLQSRLRDPLNRHNSSSSERGGPGTSATVYSRDLDRTATQSTRDSAARLSRTSSRTSQLTIDSITRAVGLGQPSDDAHVLPLHRPVTPTAGPSSSFGSTVTDAQLPALGPPAYRPSSSTLQTPSRFSISRVPVPGVAVTDAAAGTSRRPHVEQEAEDWHWPGEKGRSIPSSSSNAVASSSTGVSPLALVDRHDDEEPPQDRSLYSAHLATDDKAVLARIRQQAEAVSATAASTLSAPRGDGEDDEIGPPSVLGLASAPEPPVDPFDDDGLDVDEDGFERFPYGSSSGSTRIDVPEPSAPPQVEQIDDDQHQQESSSSSSQSFMLPTPPRPVTQSLEYLVASGPSPSSSSSRYGGLRTSALPRDVEENDLRQVEERGVLPVYEPSRGEVHERRGDDMV